MRQRLSIGALLLAVLAVAQPAHAQVKLAFVDVQRALNECDAGKRAKSEFQSKIQLLDSRLQRQQNEVEGLKDELEKKGMLMQPDQRQNLQDQYVKKAKDLDRDLKDARDDLQRQDNEITSKILHDLGTIIRNLGEQSGYTLVMEKGSILYGSSSLDITDQVIRSYNASHVQQIGTLGEGAGGAAQRAGASSPGDFGSNAARNSSISK
ncbi:MAG TPA: OmpH family outer membrane protein [Candidatus Binataceae bacterium]|nr:OmpH family outer membrane protein [Candidatus Binataceae bacterium]